MEKILNKTKVYFAGPMQYENGLLWRKKMGEELSQIGIVPLDPYKSPFMNSFPEDEQSHERLRKKMEDGLFDEVSLYMKRVRRHDLACVDKSDFVIAYINPSVFTAGTMEELVLCVETKKPTFLVIEGGKEKTPFWIMAMFPHKYIYNSFEDVVNEIIKINNGEKIADSDRWRLLKPELR